MSASVRSSTGLPAWRAAVIGLVGLLAVGIGAAAGSFLLTARTPGVGSAAAYVPAAAPFYVEMRIEPSTAQDAELRELLARFPPIEGIDLEQALHGQVVDRIDALLAEEDAEVSWGDDVAPWFDGHLAFAMIELTAQMMELPADPMAVPEVPPMVVFLGVTDADAAAAGIGRLLAAAGENAPTFTETEHAGVTISAADGSEHGAYALAGDQLIIGSDREAVMVALDTHAAGSGTLAEVADMTRLTERLPADWLIFATYDLTDVMAASLAGGAAASPELTAAFESLMEHQPMRGAMAVSAAGDRILLDSATAAPTGPFAVENADRGLADEVPADALYYSEAGNLGEAFVAIIGPMKEALATVPEAEEQISTIEAALGADIEELVSWIDDGAITIGHDGSQPYGGMVLVPNDVEAAERRLGQLATFAGLGAIDPASGISVDEGEVAGTTVTTVRWQDPEMAAALPIPTGVVLQFAVTADRALIGVGDGFVARALELDEADSLASQPRYTEAIAQLGGATNAGVTWFDLAGTREAVETALGPLLEVGDPEGIYGTLIRPWLLPLDRAVSVLRLDGDALVQRAALLVE